MTSNNLLWRFFLVVMAVAAGSVANRVVAQQGTDLGVPMQAGAAVADPSDTWLNAYLIMQEGEEYEEAGDDLLALSKFRESQKQFDYIARVYPNWKSKMIEYRRKNLLDRIHNVQARLERKDPQGLRNLPQVAPAVPQPLGDGHIVRIPDGSQELAPQPGIVTPQPTQIPMTTGAPPSTGTPIQDISQQLTQMQDTIDRLTGREINLKQQLQVKDQTITNLQGELATTRKSEQEVRAQLNQAVAELQEVDMSNSGKVKQLEANLQLATVELQKTTQKSLEILKALETAQAEAERLRQANVALQEQTAAMSENGAQLAVKLKQAEEARNAAREQRDEQAAELAEVTKERDELKEMRHSWGLFRDRRPDLYGPLLTLDGSSSRRSGSL